MTPRNSQARLWCRARGGCFHNKNLRSPWRMMINQQILGYPICGKKTINRSLESCSTHLKAAVELKGTIHQPFLRWVSAEGGPFDQHGEGGCDPVQGEKGLAWTRALHLEQSMAPATRNQTLGLAESVMVRVALHVCAAFSCPPIFAPWVVPIYQHVNVCKCTPIMAEM